MNAKVAIVMSALLAAVAATPFTDCGSVSTLSSVSISGCDALPCTFQRGTNVTIAVEWTSHTAIADFHAEILITVDGNFIQVPGLCDAKLPGECSGCSDLTKGDCPLQSAEVATYTRTLTVDASWPVIAQAEEAIFKIDSEPADEVLVCFSVPVIVN